jgi:hypothetical protein
MPEHRLHVGDDVFESGCEMIDVTSCHRPDTNWRYTDQHGHLHQWFADGVPATSYRPGAQHTVPSLVWVKDGEEWYDDDDEPHDIGHLECTQCGEHVSPVYTADTNTQRMAGLRWYCINGSPVSEDEFRSRLPK